MENNGNSKNALLSLLLIIIILLGGFLVYDKLLKKEDTAEPNKTECKCENTTQECSCPSCDSTNTTTTNSYQTFSANLKKKITSNGTKAFLGKDCAFEGSDDQGNYIIPYKIILTNKMNLMLVFDKTPLYADSPLYRPIKQQEYIKKYGEEVKIASNVISFTVAQAGPGAYQNIYFINENGTIGVSEPYDLFNGIKNKLPITTQLSNYKNIVSIVQGSFDDVGSTQDPYAIDINGNATAIQSAWN